MVFLLAVLSQLLNSSIAVPTPAPEASAGPCAAPSVSSIADRPGIGRGPAASGAVCVAPPGTIVIGIGYRSQVTGNGSQSQHLVVGPAPVILAGVAGNNELVVAPGFGFSRRAGGPAFGLGPVDGQQDIGIGIQHLLSDRVLVQQAVELFATYPSGYPAGPSGFMAGGATYQFAYTVAVPLGTIFGLTISNTVNVAPGLAPDNAIQRYIAYQPSATVSIAITSSTTLLLEDQIATLTAPHGTSGNRSLLGLQQTLSPNFVVDVDYERNLLPPAGFVQHTTFEGGMTIRL
jgi:hypothetical protein